jgi:hypothetical protein
MPLLLGEQHCSSNTSSRDHACCNHLIKEAWTVCLSTHNPLAYWSAMRHKGITEVPVWCHQE